MSNITLLLIAAVTFASLGTNVQVRTRLRQSNLEFNNPQPIRGICSSDAAIFVRWPWPVSSFNNTVMIA
ncbi:MULTISPECIES: hypothetical protein [Pirellulaceae]|uniref:hypothetical protein n=1 Tax=Pirellulaceae TaxID=2691357 RepID=UPI0011B053D2|nr:MULTISPECIES: hypothetical protein [Pirellulaceae]